MAAAARAAARGPRGQAAAASILFRAQGDKPFGKDRTGPLGRIGKDWGALKNEFLQKSTKILKITQNSYFGGPALC